MVTDIKAEESIITVNSEGRSSVVKTKITTEDSDGNCEEFYISLVPGDVANFNKMAEIIGEIHLGIQPDERYEVFKEMYKESLESPDLKQVYIYDINGYISSTQYVLGRYLVTKNSYKVVRRSEDKGAKIPASVNDRMMALAPAFIKKRLLRLHNKSIITQVWLSYEVLSYFTPRLERSIDNFAAALAAVGRTQTGKTSTSSVFFNPQSLLEYQLNIFDSSESAISSKLEESNSVCTIFDDFAHATADKNERVMFEKIIRDTGDGAAGKTRVSRKTGRVANKGISLFPVITAERLIVSQPSSVARLILTEFDKSSTNLRMSGYLEKRRALIVAAKIYLLQGVMNMGDKQESLKSSYISKKSIWLDEGKLPQPRFYNNAAWLEVSAELINELVGAEVINIERFRADLTDLFINQWKYAREEKEPIEAYISCFLNMYTAGKFSIVKTMNEMTSQTILKSGDKITFSVGGIYNLVIKELNKAQILDVPSKTEVSRYFNKSGAAENTKGATQPRYINGVSERCISLYLSKLNNLRKEDLNEKTKNDE